MDAILKSRDARVTHQAHLLGEYPGKTLLCLTVVLPGSVKRSEVSLKIAASAVEAVRAEFSPAFEELRDLETGYEGYFIVDSSPVDAKRRAVTIEETHPLGRLFDLDVIIHASLDLPYFEDGVRPIGRQELGLPQRKCLICGKPVRECMRTRSHTPEELITRIESIVEKSHIIMYKYKQSGNTYILSLDNHVEVTAALAAFCEERGIQSGSIEGLGAVSEATFRYLNPETMKYVDKTFREQMEITALVGNISRKDGKPYLHIHITASRSDYSCIGGHLLTARINGACELFVKDLGVEVGRCLDEETGINLYSL